MCCGGQCDEVSRRARTHARTYVRTVSSVKSNNPKTDVGEKNRPTELDALEGGGLVIGVFWAGLG